MQLIASLKFILPASLIFAIPAILMAQPKDSTTLFNKQKQLSGVVVTSKKPFIEQLIDKTVINVQSDITAAGATVFEILQRAPGISITGEDNITMSGKGSVNILVDGRPVQMSQRDLANYLKATPGSEIDKIEIISNPSSKYDAQGNAGIVNIRFRKNRSLGTNGSASVNYELNTHHRFGSSVSLNNRSAKMNVFGSYSLTEGLQHTSGGVHRYIITGIPKIFENNTIDKDKWLGHTFRLGADYFIGKKTTIGFLIKGNIHHTGFNTPGWTLIKNVSTGETDSSIAAFNRSDFDTRQINYNLNYAYGDTMGNELNIDADFTDFTNNVSTDIQNRLLNKTGGQYGLQENLLGITTGIRIYTLKGDYVKSFKKNSGKIEAGVKTSYVRTDNALEAQRLSNNYLITDTGRTNNFLYREYVQAAYFSFSQRIKKFEYQFGARAEQTVIRGVSTDLVSSKVYYPDTSYLTVFPTAYARYQFNDKHQLAISYNRRINRPDYQDMNPFETIIDLYTAERGNPYLRPEFQHNLELKYNYKNSISVSLGYSLTNDVIQEIAEQQADKAFSEPYNLATKKNQFLSINLPLTLTKWWSFYLSATVYYSQLNAVLPEGILANRSWGLSGYFSNSFTVSKNMRMQLSSWFQVPGFDGFARTQPFGSIDWGMQQDIFNKKATIRFGINDLFNTQKVVDKADFLSIRYTYYRKWESRGMRLGLVWKFGNKNVKLARERTIAEDAERIK